MGGLRSKMPATCWTFFLAVLAIAGAGIPWSHWGLGGFYSKDEILAVAYQRAYLWDQPLHHEEAAHASIRGRSVAVAEEPLRDMRGDFPPSRRERMRDGPMPTAATVDVHRASQTGSGEGGDHSAHGTGTSHESHEPSLAAKFPDVRPLPKWMFWLPILIAYVTPFYMMRCWCMTFAGRPRDPHIHAHAHERPIMYVPLIVLAIFTVLCATVPATSFRHLVADAAHGAAESVVGDKVSALVPAVSGEALHGAHEALGGLVGFAFIVGISIAWMIYRRDLATADALLRGMPLARSIHRALSRRLYFDDVYDLLLVGGTRVFAMACGLFDKIVVDGLVNLTAALTRVWAMFTGRQLDMPVRTGDIGFVDGLVNGVAGMTQALGGAARRMQTGRIRLYILTAAGAAGVVLLSIAFSQELESYLRPATAATAMK